MKVLIVCAHPEPRSLNVATMEKAAAILRNLGHEIDTSDLYESGFADICDQSKGVSSTNVKNAIESERIKVENADALIIQFPLWWLGMPAVLVSWAEMVFAEPWGFSKTQSFNNGRFSNKRVLLSVTTGGSSKMYEKKGLNGCIEQILFPIQHGIFNLCGFQVLPPLVGYSVAQFDKARDLYFSNLEGRLNNLFEEKPIKYNEVEMFKSGVLISEFETDLEKLRKT